MSNIFPTNASVVVIGGGVMGCSTAYHLAKAGCRDVVLLERKQLTSGTSWHSAAQVRALRSSENLTRMIQYSTKLYQSLEEETGQSTGWLQTGSLSLATNKERFIHIKRQASLARLFGIEVNVVSPEEAGRLWPLIRTDDLVGAVWSPEDGRVNPSDLCAALTKAARANGAHIVEDAPVTGFTVENRQVTGVETPHGTIACETVALCAGLWSHSVAALAGVSAPLHACEHFYLLTQPLEEVEGHLPTLGDHDAHLYLRDDVGGLLVGSFEPNARAIGLNQLPKDFAFDLLAEDWDHFEPMLKNGIHRVPALEQAEARMLLNGPESFTPDGRFLLGESPELRGFFLGCGMNSAGMASSGGAGRWLAEWIISGEPTLDLWPVDIRRFAPFHNNMRMLRERAPEVLSMHYVTEAPHREFRSARDVRHGPLHERQKMKGAYFSQRMGWERPSFFATDGVAVNISPTFSRPDFEHYVAAEHAAAEQAAAGGHVRRGGMKVREIRDFFDSFDFKKVSQGAGAGAGEGEKQEFVNKFDKLVFRIEDIPHLSEEGKYTYTIKAFEGGDDSQAIPAGAQALYSSGGMRWGEIKDSDGAVLHQGIYEFSKSSNRVSSGLALSTGGRIVPPLPWKRWQLRGVGLDEANRRKDEINAWLPVYKRWVKELK